MTTSTIVKDVYFGSKKIKDDLDVAQEIAIYHISKLPREAEEVTVRHVLATICWSWWVSSKELAFMSSAGVSRSIDLTLRIRIENAVFVPKRWHGC